MGRLGVGAYVSVRDLVTTLGYGGWRGTVIAEASRPTPARLPGRVSHARMDAAVVPGRGTGGGLWCQMIPFGIGYPPS
jgi:hypothetical protein